MPLMSERSTVISRW